MDALSPRWSSVQPPWHCAVPAQGWATAPQSLMHPVPLCPSTGHSASCESVLSSPGGGCLPHGSDQVCAECAPQPLLWFCSPAWCLCPGGSLGGCLENRKECSWLGFPSVCSHTVRGLVIQAAVSQWVPALQSLVQEAL